MGKTANSNLKILVGTYLILLLFFPVINAEEKGEALVLRLLKFDTVLLIKGGDRHDGKPSKVTVLKQGKKKAIPQHIQRIIVKGRDYIVGYSSLSEYAVAIHNDKVSYDRGHNEISLEDFLKLFDKQIKKANKEIVEDPPENVKQK